MDNMNENNIRYVSKNETGPKTKLVLKDHIA